MDQLPQIQLLFTLTKVDSADFDRDAVTRRLCIKPTKTSAPTLSKGMLVHCPDIQEASKEFSGITIVPASSPPYQMIKHACWGIDLSKIGSWSLDVVLQRLEEILCGKESDVLYICKHYDLNAHLTARVFAESNNMPDLTIPSKSVLFWASMSVSIGFEFYLD